MQGLRFPSNLLFLEELIQERWQMQEQYIFVEVKTRLSKKFGNPVDSVDYKKLKHFISASRYYIYVNKLERKKIRFDIIEVYSSAKLVPLSLLI